MPVDLSMIGLQGIKTANDTADSAQARLQSIAQTQKVDLENQTTQRDIELDQQASAALARIAGGSVQQDVSVLFKDVNDDSSAAKPLDIVANIMLKGGAIKRGTDLMKAASDIRRDESLNERDKIENAKDKVQTVLETANAVAQTIGISKNESEWRYGLAQLRKNQVLPPEQLDQLDAMDYDPNVVAYLNDQALTAYQRAQLDLTANRDAVSKRQADDRITNAQSLTTIARARLKLAQEAQDRANKAGKAATAPNDNEIAGASAAITSQVFNGKTPTTAEEKALLKAGAVAIASRTQQLLRENKALDYETALNRAIIESQTAGDWKETDTSKFGGLFGKDMKVTSFGKGKTPATALVLPQAPDGKPDAKKLVKGKFYITAKGKARWTGSGFELASE